MKCNKVENLSECFRMYEGGRKKDILRAEERLNVAGNPPKAPYKRLPDFTVKW
jgi:hypothetical protein